MKRGLLLLGLLATVACVPSTAFAGDDVPELARFCHVGEGERLTTPTRDWNVVQRGDMIIRVGGAVACVEVVDAPPPVPGDDPRDALLTVLDRIDPQDAHGGAAVIDCAGVTVAAAAQPVPLTPGRRSLPLADEQAILDACRRALDEPEPEGRRLAATLGLIPAETGTAAAGGGEGCAITRAMPPTEHKQPEPQPEPEPADDDIDEIEVDAEFDMDELFGDAAEGVFDAAEDAAHADEPPAPAPGGDDDAAMPVDDEQDSLCWELTWFAWECSITAFSTGACQAFADQLSGCDRAAIRVDPDAVDPCAKSVPDAEQVKDVLRLCAKAVIGRAVEGTDPCRLVLEGTKAVDVDGCDATVVRTTGEGDECGRDLPPVRLGSSRPCLKLPLISGQQLAPPGPCPNPGTEGDGPVPGPKPAPVRPGLP